jgi:hypothetical protein
MGHANTPPQLPEITDEAGNTPRWVPLLGAILFLASVAAIVVCHGGCGDKAEGAADAPAGETAP